MRPFTSFGPAFVVLLTAGAMVLVVPRVLRGISDARTVRTVELARAAADSTDVLEQLNAAVRSVAQGVEPSVVHIDVGRMRSSGSGWVYDAAGHIVTNAHVVGPASRVSVQFYDGRVVEGTVVGSDPLTDVAVVRVAPGDHIVPARRATGLRVFQGDRVFAFGSPFNFKFSMSEGIVSGLGRSANAGAGFAGISNFIQTDAAVNPGNSGGPLVDIRGRVVGMNVAIATAENSGGTSEGQNSGISFAIPLSTIESRAEQLIAGGPVRMGYVGIRFARVSTTIERRGAFLGRGVRVDEAPEGEPADRAGILSGDIITAIDDEPMTDGDVLRAIVSSKRPGSLVTLRVYRDGEFLDIAVTLGDRPREARVADLELILLQQYGLRLGQGDEQVLLADIAPDSFAPASQDGPIDPRTIVRLRDGVPIAEVMGRPVISVGSAQKAPATVSEALDALEQGGLFRGRSVEITVRARDSAGNDVPRTITLRRIEP